MDGLAKRALEHRLRERGMPKSVAVAAVSRGWRWRWIARVSPRAFVWIAMRGARRG